MIEKLRILLADDDRDDSEMLEEALHKASPGISISIVSDGKKAVDFLTACSDENMPDGIILDYNMPHMNGPQVLDWLCDKPGFNGMNKFVWSTANQPEYIDGCLGKGAIEYFVKPNNEQGIIAIAERIVAHCTRTV